MQVIAKRHKVIIQDIVYNTNVVNVANRKRTVLIFAVRIIEVFMDTTKQINVSQRSLELVMLCSMMMFMLFEAKFQIKSEETDSGSVMKYFASGLSTVAFTLLTVLPYLVVSLFWCFEQHVIVLDVLECCIMLFAASRLLTLRDQ